MVLFGKKETKAPPVTEDLTPLEAANIAEIKAVEKTEKRLYDLPEDPIRNEDEPYEGTGVPTELYTKNEWARETQGEVGPVSHDWINRPPDSPLTSEEIEKKMPFISGKHKEKIDLINKPPHYTRLQPEPLDVIEAWELPFHESQILKYIARWPAKGGIADLRKAEFYLKRLIAREEKKTHNE